MNLWGFLSEIYLHYSTVNPRNFPKKTTKNLWGFPVKSALEYPLKICNLSLLKLSEFPSYLSGRSYKVKIGNSLSESVACEVGVPQGSVLRPILFNCFMARLPQILRVRALVAIPMLMIPNFGLVSVKTTTATASTMKP